MAVNNIVRGTMLLTAATFFSKFLGMIYVIPFYDLVGTEGGSLYQYAYIPYNILISISTVGVPLAVSKFVSKYNSLGDYQTGRKMFKAGIGLMSMTGFIAFLVMFFGADLLAQIYIPDDSKGISASDVAMVIKMVSFALLVIPAMSIVRGFFQGYESMGPTAVSQVIEQIVRIVFLLVAVYLIIEVFNGSTRLAVGFATFAAFVGAIASCIVLWFFWKKRKKHLDREVQQQEYTYDLPMKDLFKELFRYAGPFVLVGVATPLYQFIDSVTFKRAITAIGQGDIADIALSNINLYGHKLVIIPVTLATGMSLAVLPAITKSFTEQNHQRMFQQINQSLQTIMLLILPAVVGLSLLSNEAYGALYGLDETLDINGPLLGWYAPVALMFGFFTVSSSILQGINQQRFAVVSLTAGLMVKTFLNIPFIHTFGAKGAVFATSLAVFTAVCLNLWRMKNAIGFPMKQFTKRSMLIAIFSAIMAVVVWLVKWIISFFITYQDGRIEAVIVLVIGVLAGMVVYLWLSYESTLLERVLGNRVRLIDKLFKRKRT
ncbi:putative polysaccharide biosynthesis protein [Sediminibacillus albus]|uniref:Membrane protein involved in the export of O-antigen and teichoic acid n=1 Tax=Sediminibacillus albus TaxID=407036 RepID=A0A1G9BZ45_9BACI|nr:polysaccharide biosynthesis protein [Sediminibacillus albus]SDK44729.1 Membrane protein involved in the export of O-antigen and teichoic acid [Sediminibacillus albus]